MTQPNATPPPPEPESTAEVTAATVAEMIGAVEAVRVRITPAMLQNTGTLPAELVADLTWTAAALGSTLSTVADAIAGGGGGRPRLIAMCRDVQGSVTTLNKDMRRLRDAVAPVADTVPAAASGGVKVLCAVCKRPIVTAAAVSVLNVWLRRAVDARRVFVVSRHTATGAPTFYRHAACPAPTDTDEAAAAP